MAQKKNYDPRKSSVAVGGEKKKRGLLPLLLGLLALLIAIVVIALLIGSCGDDDNDSAAAPSTPTAAAPTTSAPAATPAPADGASGTTGASGASGAGTLTAASQSLLGADAASIGDQVDQDATGTGVKVLSVSEGGFFVGTDDADRQYVEFGGNVGGDEADSTLPAVGDTVDLTGPVKAAPKSAGTTLKLSDADAQTVSDRGSYINADSVTPSTG